MDRFVVLNGDLIKEKEAKISIFDRGFLFGEGIYLAAKVMNGVVVFFEDHNFLFNKSLSKLGLQYDISLELINKLVTANNKQKGSYKIKVIVSSGVGSIEDLSNRVPTVIYMLIDEVKTEKAVAALISDTVIEHLFVDSKSLSRLDRIHLLHNALNNGFDDGISINRNGSILESSFGNIFWIVGKTLYTPKRNLGFLFGVTIWKVLDIAKSNGYDVQEVEACLEDIPIEAEVMRSSSFSGVVKIKSINDREFSSNNKEFDFFRNELDALELKYTEEQLAIK